MEIVDLNHPQLQIKHLKTSPGQSWCFYGENNSSIHHFMLLLEGQLSDAQSSAKVLELDKNPGILSFRAQQELYEEELRNDDTDFLDRIDPGTSGSEFLEYPEKVSHLLQTLNMESCLATGLRQLSSGQNRKLIMLRQIVLGCSTIILQNPFDGLDVLSCDELNDALQQLAGKNIGIILVVNSRKDIPGWCSHLGIFEGQELSHCGALVDVHEKLATSPPAENQSSAAPIITNGAGEKKQENSLELIKLVNGFASYGGNLLFTGLNLTVNRGDHTLIYGPNGCGKSTLLDIITGDNPKCYANELLLFGKQRGTGESIWEIKQKMGIISPSLHRDHRVPGSALHVVLSGLFDSIGLYKKVSNQQVRQAKRWLQWLGLERKAEISFRHLAFAEQRLILIGRALIKHPSLLIFDEATQGLDDSNREKLLDLLDRIAREKISTILFVSHRTDEYRSFFTRKIKLDAYGV